MALRKSLAAREQELEAAKSELSHTIIRLALLPEREAEIGVLKDNLEAMRAELDATKSDFAETQIELAETVSKKSVQIDELEQIVLDLRKSREDLLVEDSQRLEALQKQLDGTIKELGKVTEGAQASIAQLEELRRVHESVLAEKEATASETSAHIARLSSEISKLQADRAASVSSAESNRNNITQLEINVTSLRKELDSEIQKRRDLEVELSAAHAALQEAEAGRKVAQDDLDRFQKAAMENETELVAELKTQLASERERNREAQALGSRELSELRHELERERVAAKDNFSLLQVEQEKCLQLECLTANLQREKTQAEAKHLSQTEDLLQRLDGLERGLASKNDKIALLESEVAKANSANTTSSARSSSLSTELAAAKITLETAEVRHQSQLDSLQAEVSALTKQLVTTMSSHREDVLSAHTNMQNREKELQDEIDRLKHAAEQSAKAQFATESTRNEEIKDLIARLMDSESQVATLSRANDELVAREDQAQAELARQKNSSEIAISAERERADQATHEAERFHITIVELQREAARMSVMEKTVEASALEIQELRTMLQEAQQKYADCDQRASNNQDRVHKLARELQEAEAHALDKSNRLVSLEAEIGKLRSDLSSMQQKLVLEQQRSSESIERSQRMATELEDLRQHHCPSANAATDPYLGIVSGSSIAVDGAPPSSPDRLVVLHAAEEIDRLEKVVEAQQLIIDDQKEKIKFWARVRCVLDGISDWQELEQQREIVRALTLNADLSPPSRPSPRRHARAKSASETGSPRTGDHDVGVKKFLPSTFTAFNLAMPSTPTPLPMHPSQFDNTSARKGRRLTIEHDIGLLTGK